MPPEVVDTGQLGRPRRRQTLGDPGPDQQAAGQPRTSGDGDQVDVGGFGGGAFEGQVEQVREALEVIAGGQLGDDASKTRVQVDLRMDDVREDMPSALDQGDRGLVTGGLDPEGESFAGQFCVRRSRLRPWTSASIRSRFDSYARRNLGEWMESDHITIASSPLSV